MKSNLLSELERIVNSRSDFPIPSYLFVQQYGRSIQNELKEIAEALGREDSFYFKTEAAGKEYNILQRFRMEEEMHAGLGRKFDGCVLIRISGEEPKKEMDEFLDYLEEEQQRISCLYTTENYEKVYDIGKKLEQFFFVRVVYGRKYELQEQMYLFCKNLDKYKLKLSREAFHF